MFLWSYVTFPRSIVCVDFIFEVSSVIPPLPTEKKNFRWQQTWKSVFQEYLNIASTHEFSDCRFGIYAKSWVYTKFFYHHGTFFGGSYPPILFLPQKTGFCCSWTAKSGLRSTDHRFEKFRVESIYPQEESCFFFETMWDTPFMCASLQTRKPAYCGHAPLHKKLTGGCAVQHGEVVIDMRRKNGRKSLL